MSPRSFELSGPDVGGQIRLKGYAARNIDEVNVHHNKKY
jgi:hypothetical protein